MSSKLLAVSRGLGSVGRLAGLAGLALGIAGCSSSGSNETSLFPANYAQSYTMVRPCRSSSDHDLNHVKVFADPAALVPYTMRDRPFPTGAVVLKEEYEFSDDDCTGPLKEWTVMVKLDDGSAAKELDWHWQHVDADRSVMTDQEPRCYGCHATCGVPPDGYLITCSAR